MDIIVSKSTLQGNIDLIGSKSYTHRAFLASFLTPKKIIIKNPCICDDTLTSLNVIKDLGANVEIKDNEVIIERLDDMKPNKDLYFNESGTTLRLFFPYLVYLNKPFKLHLGESLKERPMQPYFDILDHNQIQYKIKKDMIILKKGRFIQKYFELIGSISSQFVSGMLFMMPKLEDNTRLYINSELESRQYVEMSLDVLKKSGIIFKNNNYENIEMVGDQGYHFNSYTVEPDMSQAAYFRALNIFGNHININNDINTFTLQEDINFLKLYHQIGGTIDLKNNIDLAPLLFMLASIKPVKTIFTGTARLKYKESNRIEAMKIEIEKYGASLDEEDDMVTILGVSELPHDIIFNSHNDHRIAMSFIVLSLISNTNTILGVECISKSYPNFIEIVKKLGGNINEKNA